MAEAAVCRSGSGNEPNKVQSVRRGPLAFLLFIKAPDHRIGFLFSLPIAVEGNGHLHPRCAARLRFPDPCRFEFSSCLLSLAALRDFPGWWRRGGLPAADRPAWRLGRRDFAWPPDSLALPLDADQGDRVLHPARSRTGRSEPGPRLSSIGQPVRACSAGVVRTDFWRDGSNVKVVFRDFQLRENDRFVVRAVGTVRTPEVFQGPVEIIKKKPPKATDSPDFHRPGSFHSPRRPLKLKRALVHAGALDLSHQLFSYGVEPNVYRSE